jgi:hypothetical protein
MVIPLRPRHVCANQLKSLRGAATADTPSSSRHRHRSALVLVLIFAALTLGVSLPATAVAAKRHVLSIKGSDAIVERGSDFVVAAGVFNGRRPFQRGAIVQRVFGCNCGLGQTASKFTLYTRRGTISGTGRSTRTLQPDGSTTAVGSRTVTRGTGTYKGARGRLRLSGVSKGGITTFRWRGTIRY